MPWKIEIDAAAEKELTKLNREISARLVAFLRERLGPLEDPRDLGRALRHSDGFWRYRVGDYRIICRIVYEDRRIVVLAFRHRREVYRQR